MGTYREVISELEEPTRSSEEVGEALGVALLMDGGTASVYGPRAREAFEQFAPSTPEEGA